MCSSRFCDAPRLPRTVFSVVMAPSICVMSACEAVLLATIVVLFVQFTRPAVFRFSPVAAAPLHVRKRHGQRVVRRRVRADLEGRGAGARNDDRVAGSAQVGPDVRPPSCRPPIPLRC